MTRTYVYSTALVAFLAATSMIVASIWLPTWVTFTTTTTDGQTITTQYGLHQSCTLRSDSSTTCHPFPYPSLCHHGERYFCSMWRTIGFLSSFSVILCLAGIVSFVVIMSGGKYKRETGWVFVGGMMSLVAVVEVVIVSLVAYLYENDEQFLVPGWRLDRAWYVNVVSVVLCLVAVGGLAGSAYLLPPEEGYEFLDDPVYA